MSVALVNASRLKPEIRLAQAVSEFEADLSTVQKGVFRIYASQSRDSSPNPSDVMRLTAEIDRRVSGNTGSRRCFGPRLTSFLQAVQQFAALGDIILGGSQNLIASAVWSVSIVNFSSYLEKLSNLLMDIGRSAPRYQMMVLLYPRSKNLQAYLSEYFIVVVRLCHQSLKFTQRSAFGQFASSLSDHDMKTYQSDLGLWANTIKEEVGALMAKKIEEEAQENHRVRALLSKDSRCRSLEQRLKTNVRVLDFCSTYDYETTWKQTRKVGTATLFNRSAEYLEWISQAHSCTLLYTGKLGSGKSVLLATIVDDINLHVPTKDTAVVYFFCRHDISESLKARTVMGSLARQLLSQITDLTMVAEFVDGTIPALDFQRILALLQRALPPDYKAYVILDGLDECDYAEREILIQQLRKLQETFRVLLCVSFRLQPDSALDLGIEHFHAANITSIPDDNPDIEAFIREELARCIETKKLVIGNPALILEVQDALLEGSQGMFLWVALQFESLCNMKTDDAIRQALRDLPKDLPETFSRILRRSERLGKPYQRRILELVTVARRPFTTEELREALSVVPGDAHWNSARLLNDVFSTLACCGSLVTVDEEELTIRFVHHSVKQFLLSISEHSTDIAFTTDSANRTMADIIITYLNYGVFGTQLSTAVTRQIMTGSAPSQIICSTLDSSSIVRSVALKLLNFRKYCDFDIGKTLAETNRLLSHRSMNEFHFYSYAKSYWQQHILYVSEQEPVMYNLLLRLFKGNVVNVNATLEDGRTPLLRAAENGQEAIVEVLLESGKAEANTKDDRGRTPLSWAVENGHEAVVRVLLESGEVDANLKDDVGRTPLYWATVKNHSAVVRVLLESGEVDANLKDDVGRTPLCWAAENGYKAVVQVLLDYSEVEAGSKDDRGRTPLSLAAMNGHAVVVKVLLKSGKLEADSKDKSGQTPLSLAAEYGYEAVIKMLLKSGKVDANSKDDRGRTPLSLAMKNGYEAVVRVLLEFGKVDAKLTYDVGRTPLYWGVGRMPLYWAGGRTSLYWAAEYGHGAVIKMLLKSGKVGVNLKDDRGRTRLSLAMKNGHGAIVRVLLESGEVDANSTDDVGRTPLSWAAEYGHETFIKMLLKSGKVDANLKDDRGRTPLS